MQGRKKLTNGKYYCVPICTDFLAKNNQKRISGIAKSKHTASRYSQKVERKRAYHYRQIYLKTLPQTLHQNVNMRGYSTAHQHLRHYRQVLQKKFNYCSFL